MVVSTEKVFPVIAPKLFVKIKDQDNIPYLGYAKQTFLYNLVEPLMRKSPIKLNQIFEATLSESLVKMAINGYGLTWAPWHAVETEIENGILMPAFADNKALISTLDVICYRAKDAIHPTTEQFWNGLKTLSEHKK